MTDYSHKIKVHASNLNYQQVENMQLAKENFQTSQNIFDLFDNDQNGILDDSEINNYFYTIDASDGEINNELTGTSISKYIENSNFNEEYSTQLADFANTIFNLAQGSEANIDFFSTIDGQEDINTRLTPNGKIDDFIQSAQIGDCWLLAQAQALSSTEWGSELIYNSISTNENGDYLVSFDGVGEEILITKDELNKTHGPSSIQYSIGDADMVLLEKAMEEYLNNHSGDGKVFEQKRELAREYEQQGNPYNILSNNYMTNETSLQYVLTKNKGEEFFANGAYKTTGPSTSNTQNDSDIQNEQNYEDYNAVDIPIGANTRELLEIKAQNESSCAIMCNLNIRSNLSEYSSRGLVNNHAYAVSSKIDEAGNMTVVLTNPHNTQNKIELGFDEFKNIADRIGVIENAA